MNYDETNAFIIMHPISTEDIYNTLLFICLNLKISINVFKKNNEVNYWKENNLLWNELSSFIFLMYFIVKLCTKKKKIFFKKKNINWIILSLLKQFFLVYLSYLNFICLFFQIVLFFSFFFFSFFLLFLSFCFILHNI